MRDEHRSVKGEKDKGALLAATRHADEAVICDTSEKLECIYLKLGTDVVGKGSDWTVEQIRERNKIPDHSSIKIFLYKSFSMPQVGAC